MKNLMIAIALFCGMAVVMPSNSNAQCCQKGTTSCKKGTASCEKDGKAGTQTKCVTGMVKDSLKVMGKCGSCKTRIEKATKGVKGITDAQWNDATNMLVYAYEGTVKKQDVSDAITKVGHDTELGKAPDKVYNSLPACCKYR